MRVHLDLPAELLADDYVLLTVDFGDLGTERLETMPDAPAELGNTWLRSQRTPLLSLPSAIVAETANLLLNPAHPRAAGARVTKMRPFKFDPRLWRPR